MQVLVAFWESVQSGKRNRPGRPRMIQEKATSMVAVKLRKHEEACDKIMQLMEPQLSLLEGTAAAATPRRRLGSKTRSTASSSTCPQHVDTEGEAKTIPDRKYMCVEVSYQYTQENMRTRRTVRGHALLAASDPGDSRYDLMTSRI